MAVRVRVNCRQGGGGGGVVYEGVAVAVTVG